jgi:hypothetical protein
MSTCRYIMFYINSQCDYLSTSISPINRHQTHQCDYLSPFDINGKGPFSSWGFSPYLNSFDLPMNNLSPFEQGISLGCNTEIISVMLSLKPCLCPLHLINLIHLEPCLYPLHLINLSPFFINNKGIFPSGAAPPERVTFYGSSSCTSKTYNISIQKAFIFGVEITPSLWRRYSKASRGSGFVKMSATCSFVPTYSTLMFFSATCSYRK